jgi:arylsulfatase A-like enzyme
MTGKYNFRNYTGFGVLSPRETTFGHIFQQSGYATCAVGKWQLWGHSDARGRRGQGVYPDNAGFDEYCLWQIEERKERYADPYLYRNSRVPEAFPEQFGPDLCCDYLCDFIERRKEQPFLAYYPMMLTHDPFVPTPDSPEWLTGRRNQQDIRFFGHMVTYMDKIIGRIATHLDRLRLTEKTLLIFLSDNGTHRSVTSKLGDKIIQGAKGRPTDAGTRVPLIASWPGVIPKAQVSSDLVDTTDFLPTIVEAAGIPIPEDFSSDGRSFVPQLRGESGNPREWVFCHYDPDWGSFCRARFVRDQRWKLYEDGRFFDIPADSLEENPIPQGSGTDEAEATRARFRKVLDRMQ